MCEFPERNKNHCVSSEIFFSFSSTEVQGGLCFTFSVSGFAYCGHLLSLALLLWHVVRAHMLHVTVQSGIFFVDK